MPILLAVLLSLITVPCGAGEFMLIGAVQQHLSIAINGQQSGPEAADIVTLSVEKPVQQSTLTCKSNVPYKVTATTIPQHGDPSNALVSYYPQSSKILSLSHDTPLNKYLSKTEILWGQPTLNRGEDCILEYKIAPDNNLLYGDSVVAIVRYQIESRL